jgi:hypothetical protein
MHQHDVVLQRFLLGCIAIKTEVVVVVHVGSPEEEEEDPSLPAQQ